MDSIPVVSQLKSLVQWIADDEEGALETQKNFSKRCPVVSQVRSFVEWIDGDAEAALNTQKEFGGEVNQFVNSLPAVGHVKGGIHYIAGDRKGGDMAMKAASRTTGVALGGVAGFAVGGPVGAIAGGTTAGIAMDGIITVSDKAVNGSTADEQGLFKLVNIDESEHKAGDVVDMVGGLIFDGLTGMTAGEAYGRRSKVKLQADKQTKNAIGRENYANLEKNAAKMDGNTLRSMSKETKNIQLERQRINDQPNLSNRQRKAHIKAASKQTMHTDSNFHQLNRDPHLAGKIAADIPTESGNRGLQRVIMEDTKRNYQLKIQKHVLDHDYRSARVPEMRTPNVFDKYCDMQEGVQLTTGEMGPMTGIKRQRKKDSDEN